MYSETHSLSIDRYRQGTNLFPVYQDQADQLNCIYIGQRETSLQHFATFFQSTSVTGSITDTIILIDKILASKGAVPDVIVFDVPFCKEQLAGFFAFLKARPQVSAIPVLYNEECLDEECLDCIKSNDMIDDVINMNKRGVNFANKVAFLKKIKNHPPAPLFRKEAYAAIDSTQKTKSFTAKRLLDILISATILVLALPVFILVALVIKLDSKGPVFYTSLRAGKGFKVFRFFKFRTMEVDADQKVDALSHLNKYGTSDKGVKFLKIYNDPRVTRVGKFLRKSSIDELPQLFNVLKGDMSIVGNRPLPIYEATTLTTNEFVERFMAPAGITGLWQVNKKKNPDMTAEERVRMDISYARQYNLMYDIKIMARTPAALFQKSGS
ncbi:MAG: sugar transferase [Sphingobacteriales bacterium]|nr:sugar transferase [Sphingobacteriales bacterium]